MTNLIIGILCIIAAIAALITHYLDSERTSKPKWYTWKAIALYNFIFGVANLLCVYLF